MKVRKRKKAVYLSASISQYARSSTKKGGALLGLWYSRNKNGELRGRERGRWGKDWESGWVIFNTKQVKWATQGERQWEKACQDTGQSNKALYTKLIYCWEEPPHSGQAYYLLHKGILPSLVGFCTISLGRLPEIPLIEHVLSPTYIYVSEFI